MTWILPAAARRDARRLPRRRTFSLEALEARLALAAPVAVNDSYTTFNGATLNVAAPGVLTNDSDADGDPITNVTLVDNVDHGALTIRNDGSFDYSPSAGFFGYDTFTYKIRSQRATGLNVVRSQSQVTVNATLRTPVGNDSDSETSSVTGTTGVRLGSRVQPFGTAQISAANLVLADAVHFRFEIGCSIFGCLVTVDANSAPGALMVTLVQPGAAAPVDGANDFLQTGNTLHLNGSADVTCSGLGCGAITIPPNPQVFDDDFMTDLNGHLALSGTTLTLSVPLSFTGTFDLGGGAFLDLNMQGQIVATGAIASPEESNVATVTLNSSSTSAPAVEAVLVRGTNWTGEFLIHLDSAGLGAGGYKIPAGAAQSAPLPWSNLDQLVVVFSEPVINLPATLAINGEQTGLINFGNVTTAAGPNGSFIATWTASDGDPLPDDTITLTLPDMITNNAGVALDGDWTNGADSYPSGDGTAGGAFTFRFVSLPGDVNQDGLVNLADVADDVVHGFQRSNSGTFSAVHDVNGSAIVNAFDAVLIRDRLGSQAASLAAPASVVQAVESIRMPSRRVLSPALVRWNAAPLGTSVSRQSERGSIADRPIPTAIPSGAARVPRTSRGMARQVAAVDRALLESFGD